MRPDDRILSAREATLATITAPSSLTGTHIKALRSMAQCNETECVDPVDNTGLAGIHTDNPNWANEMTWSTLPFRFYTISQNRHAIQTGLMK